MRAEEFLSEKVNTKTVSQGFRHDKVVLDGKYRLVAAGEEQDGLKYLKIRVYPADAEPVSSNEIGFAFLRLVEPRNNDEAYLKATMVRVHEKYQKQGIASAMYSYAEELGNDLMKSDNLLPGGQALWASRERKQAEKAVA